jgi:hypothetical protein
MLARSHELSQPGINISDAQIGGSPPSRQAQVCLLRSQELKGK